MSTLLELGPVSLQISENPYMSSQIGGILSPNPERILASINNKKYKLFVYYLAGYNLNYFFIFTK